MKFSVAIFVNQMPLPRISDMSFTQYWQYNTLTYTSVCRCLSNVLPSICTMISLTYSCNILVVVITLAQGRQLLSFNARHVLCQLDGRYLLLLVIACYLHVAECPVMMCCETVWWHYSSVYNCRLWRHQHTKSPEGRKKREYRCTGTLRSYLCLTAGILLLTL